MAKTTTLLSPDGREYRTGSKTEVTRLKALGYTEAKPKPPPKKTSDS